MKNYLDKILKGDVLSKTEAFDLLTFISSGSALPSHISSLITAYLMRPIQVEELSGYQEALVSLCTPVKFEQATLDVCGTGGDGKNTFNISTISAFVIAGAGVAVAKHGNYGVSSVSGSSNVLEHLGYKFTNNVSLLQNQIYKNNICFLHAPLFHPALKHVAPVRKEMGVKTFFNMLGPLVNPANTEYKLIGVYNLELGRTYNYLLQNKSAQFQIVHSFDGYDEISLTGEFKIFSNQGESVYSPEELKFNRLKEDELFGGNNVSEAATIFVDVLQNKSTLAQQKAVIINSAFGIKCATQCTIQTAIQKAEESILSGAALKLFKNSIN